MMMSKSSDISEEDSELFRRAVGDITPIKNSTVLSNKARPAAHPKHSLADDAAVMQELIDGDYDPATLETGDELFFLRPGIQKQTMRKLRKGVFPIEDELDLHGLTVDLARAALSDFLKYCQSRGKRCVRVIHGKGLGSKNKKPVIKNKLNHWLQQRDDVLAYCSARQVDGGTGAIYLLLKKDT